MAKGRAPSLDTVRMHETIRDRAKWEARFLRDSMSEPEERPGDYLLIALARTRSLLQCLAAQAHVRCLRPADIELAIECLLEGADCEVRQGRMGSWLIERKGADSGLKQNRMGDWVPERKGAKA